MHDGVVTVAAREIVIRCAAAFESRKRRMRVHGFTEFTE